MTEDRFSAEDQTALEFSLRQLEADPEMTYRELRKDARISEDLRIRRQVWTEARRRLGLLSEPPAHEAPARDFDPQRDPPQRDHRAPQGHRDHRHADPAPGHRSPQTEGHQHRDSPQHRDHAARDEGRRGGNERIPAWRSRGDERFDRPPRDPAPRPSRPAPYAPAHGDGDRDRDRDRPEDRQDRDARHHEPQRRDHGQHRGAQSRGGQHSPQDSERRSSWDSGRRPAWSVPKPEPRPTDQRPSIVQARPNAAPGETPPPARPAGPVVRPPLAPRQPTPQKAEVQLPAVGPHTNPVEWMVVYLKSVHREATFQEVKTAAESVGLTVYPATFGRAQSLAGLLDDQERGGRRSVIQGTAPVAPQREPTAQRASRPRTPAQPTKPLGLSKAGTAASTDGIDPITGLRAFFGAMSKLESENSKLGDTTEAMLRVVVGALHPSAED